MSEKILQLRIRTRKGIFKIQKLNSNHTLNDLKNVISEVASVPYSTIKILKGYPPKELANALNDQTLMAIKIKDGDLLTIEETQSNEHNAVNSQDSNSDSFELSKHSNGTLLRKVVPSDNSCLFTSVYYVVENGVLNLDSQKFMREIISKAVKSDPDTYNEAFLGQKNKDYCEWIKNSSTWGGAIEIAILSKYYNLEICVVDIQSGRIDRFGEDRNYRTRSFIIYDGIHFDPLYLEPYDSNLGIKTRFLTTDDSVMHQAYTISNEARKSKQFTDVANFKIKCLVCQKPLKGQNEVHSHAETTGHTNYGEI